MQNGGNQNGTFQSVCVEYGKGGFRLRFRLRCGGQVIPVPAKFFPAIRFYRFHRASEVFTMKQYFAFQWHITGGDPILHPAVRRLDAENEGGAP